MRRNCVSKIMLKAAKLRTNLVLRPPRGQALVLRLIPALASARLGNSSNSPLRVPVLARDSVPSVEPVRAHLDSPPVRRVLSETPLDLGSNLNSPKLVRSASLPPVLQAVSVAQVLAVLRARTRQRSDRPPKRRVHSVLQLGRLDSQSHRASADSAAFPPAPELDSGRSGRLSRSRPTRSGSSPRRRQLDSEHLDKAVSYRKHSPVHCIGR